MTAVVLETKRLALRHLVSGDEPFVVQLLNEPAFLRNIGDRGVRTLEDARVYLEKGPLESYRQRGFGLYLVSTKAEQVAIGMCGLLERPYLPDVDVGFAFLPAFWGRGYALEAAAGVLAFGTETLRLRRIVAIVAPGNERSIRLLEKLGLRYHNMLRTPEGDDVMLFVPVANQPSDS